MQVRDVNKPLSLNIGKQLEEQKVRMTMGGQPVVVMCRQAKVMTSFISILKYVEFLLDSVL